MEYRISNKLAALKPSAIREIFKSLSDPSIIAFAAGNPAAESFPVEALAEITADIFRGEPVKALQYGQTEGYPPLREAVNKRLAEKFSIGCSVEKGDKYNDTTLIVSGGNQGIELSCKVLCNEGDIVLCEDPSFIGALNAFRSNGAITKGIPLRDDGIDTEILESTLAADRAGENKIKMLYLIPTFHNPAGITTSLEVRKKIYEIAVKYSLVILEDNPYGELRFAGEEIPTIKSMDTEGLVLYCSSFSKVLSAGMRVGYITGPEKLMQKLVVAKQVEDVHTNQLFQMLCHRFVTERDLDGHIEMIRAIYRRKCAIMMKGLDENLPKSFKFTRPEGGLFVWCTLPDGIDMTEFVARCLKNKLAIVPGTAFCPDENGTSNSVRFNYSTPSDEQIERGCVILGEVAREMLAEIK